MIIKREKPNPSLKEKEEKKKEIYKNENERKNGGKRDVDSEDLFFFDNSMRSCIGHNLLHRTRPSEITTSHCRAPSTSSFLFDDYDCFSAAFSLETHFRHFGVGGLGRHRRRNMSPRLYQIKER